MSGPAANFFASACQRMAGVDLEHRLGAFAEAAVGGEDLLELAVGGEFGRDQAGETVGQPIGGARFGDLAFERLLEERDQRRDFGRRLGRRAPRRP